jgi:hypothetical protein
LEQVALEVAVQVLLARRLVMEEMEYPQVAVALLMVQVPQLKWAATVALGL